MTKKIVDHMRRIVRSIGRKRYNAIRQALISTPFGVLLPPYSYFK